MSAIASTVFVASLAAVTVGVALWSLPAGLVVGGALGAGSAVLWARGEPR